VLGRHKAIVCVGVTLTLALAFLSYVRVSPHGISYRSPAVWANTSTLVLTQAGSPELWSVLPVQGPTGSPSLASTDRFTGLVDLYAALATGDAVVQTLFRRHLLEDQDIVDGALPIEASAVSSTVNGAIIPLIKITAKGNSPEKATRLTVGTTRAFLDVLKRRQIAAKVPVDDRIQVSVLKRSSEPTLAEPRSKTMPLLIFLAGMIATIGTAFTRDNLSGARQRAPENQEGAGERGGVRRGPVVVEAEEHRHRGPERAASAPVEQANPAGARARSSDGAEVALENRGDARAVARSESPFSGGTRLRMRGSPSE
jgi:hypothetical protein